MNWKNNDILKGKTLTQTRLQMELLGTPKLQKHLSAIWPSLWDLTDPGPSKTQLGHFTSLYNNWHLRNRICIAPPKCLVLSYLGRTCGFMKLCMGIIGIILALFPSSVAPDKCRWSWIWQDLPICQHVDMSPELLDFFSRHVERRIFFPGVGTAQGRQGREKHMAVLQFSI